MLYTTPATTIDISLDAVVERLAKHPDVEGLVLLGSARTSHFKAMSDYDLLIVVSELPLPMRVGLTHINARLADLLFATIEEIETILASDAPFNGDEWIGRIVRWCQSGTILFDRSGRLSRVKQKVMAGNWIRPSNALSTYQTWFGINYNYAQTRRMSQSQEPEYRLAVQIRLLYSLADILSGYFQLRQLLWHGEKGAIRYLATHDPEFLALFTECLHESNYERKLEQYERLVVITTTPLGGLWQEEVTAFQLDGNISTAQDGAQLALKWWQSLLDEGKRSRLT